MLSFLCRQNNADRKASQAPDVNKTLQMRKMEELKRENRQLKAVIQGLEYENKMYKKLLDNLFLHQNVSMLQDQVQPEPVQDQCQAPGPVTEVYNVLNCENDFQDLEEPEDDFEMRKKWAKEIEADEVPVVEDKEVIAKEMQNLFGLQGAKTILAMETAMQLNFEKVKDVQKAQLWPELPLNMKFDK